VKGIGRYPLKAGVFNYSTLKGDRRLRGMGKGGMSGRVDAWMGGWMDKPKWARVRSTVVDATLEEKSGNCCDDAIGFDAGGDPLGNGLDGIGGIAHGDADASVLQHFYIIEVVADRHHIFGL
jgi:hypothetical protein